MWIRSTGYCFKRLLDGDAMLLLAPRSNFVGQRAIPFGGGQQSSGGFGTLARENQRTVTCSGKWPRRANVRICSEPPTASRPTGVSG